MSSQLLSFDLWGTLLELTPACREAFVSDIESLCLLPPGEIRRRIQANNTLFDNIAIRTGTETPSTLKLDHLRESLDIKQSTKVLLAHLRRSLEQFPPRLIDANLNVLEELCTRHHYALVVASNSDFVPAHIVTDVVEHSPIGKMSAYAGTFCSDTLGVAKPSVAFFAQIQDQAKGTIVAHVGDNLLADYGARLDCTTVLYDPYDHHTDFEPADRRATNLVQVSNIIEKLSGSTSSSH